MKKLEDGSNWISTLKVIYWVFTVIIALATVLAIAGAISQGGRYGGNAGTPQIIIIACAGGLLIWALWWMTYTGYITSFKQRRTIIHLLDKQNVQGNLKSEDVLDS